MISPRLIGSLAFLICWGGLRAEDAPLPQNPPQFRWAAGSKDFVGTAANSASKVYFTGAGGILTEVFYPSPDTIQNIELQIIVMDKARTYGSAQSDEKRQARHDVRQVDPRAMVWETTTQANSGEWSISKRTFTDPKRNSVIQRITFQVLKPGQTVGDYDLFVFNKPGISLKDTAEITANKNRSHTVSSGKRTMFSASIPNATASALAVSLPWKIVNGVTMVSNGFYGVSDGWVDMFGPGGTRRMTHHYDAAVDGNVAQMGWLDLAGAQGTEVTFDVVLAFGTNEAEAVKTADATLNDDPAALEKQYVNEWHRYTGHLKPQTDDEYYLAAMTLKSSADKDTGAMVAALGSPWGNSDRPQSFDGYHQVWARDMFKFASALLAAGDTAAANQAVTFLFMKQMLPDGHFPRLSFTSGLSSGDAQQMDEVAMPIILAWKLNRRDLWPQIRKAADFLVAHGPVTGTERWEESAGYSPSTIASEIAALVCAADFAQKAHEAGRAHQYLQTADYWRNNIAGWAFTTTDPVNGRHYIRLNGPQTKAEDQNPNETPADNAKVDKRQILDGGFLELARFGVLSPNDWSIVESLPAYDATLKQVINGKGDAFFRYNYDGYGEYNDGKVWGEQDAGRGRLWPILTAERGIYEINRAADGAKGVPYLAALKSFASPAGFISEQVFNNSMSFHHPDSEVLLPPGKKAGESTGSVRPLNWAMGEYINLLLATQSRRTDAPQVVVDRYASNQPQVKVNFAFTEDTASGEALYLVGDSPMLGNDDPVSAIRLGSDKAGIWSGSVSLPANRTFHYKTFRRAADGKIEFGPVQTLTTPATGQVEVMGMENKD